MTKLVNLRIIFKSLILKKRILNLEKSINMISKNNLKRNNESNYLMTYNNDNNYRSNPFLED